MIKNSKIKLRKYLLKGIVTLLLIFITTTFAIAQTGPDGIEPNPDAGVPLEGADYLLLAMAGGYVIIKAWQYQHKKKSQQQKIQ